jgi:hypothetical protein
MSALSQAVGICSTVLFTQEFYLVFVELLATQGDPFTLFKIFFYNKKMMKKLLASSQRLHYTYTGGFF